MVNDELVERMLDAYWGERNWKNVHSPTRMESMTAALRGAADVLLGPVTADEWRAVTNSSSFASSPAHWGMERVNIFLAQRRACIAPAKTPEERVTVTHAGGLAIIHLDHEFQVQFGNEKPAERERNAEIYRLGLIATLKEGKR